MVNALSENSLTTISTNYFCWRILGAQVIIHYCFCLTDVEVACTNYEGVDAVKRALKKGLELSTENMPIKVGGIV